MALFKPFRGNRASLETQELHDGYAYFCTDDGSFHIDYVDEDGNLQRKQVNESYLQELGYKIDNLPQADWNQNDAVAADYIKNRPFYSEFEETEILNTEYTTVPFEDFGGVYGGILMIGSALPNYIYIELDNILYPNLLHKDNMYGNLSLINPLLGSEYEDTGEPFVIAPLDLESGIYIIATALIQETSHSIRIFAAEEKVVSKLDRKYLPDIDVEPIEFTIKITSSNNEVCFKESSDDWEFSTIDWGDGYWGGLKHGYKWDEDTSLVYTIKAYPKLINNFYYYGIPSNFGELFSGVEIIGIKLTDKLSLLRPYSFNEYTSFLTELHIPSGDNIAVDIYNNAISNCRSLKTVVFENVNMPSLKNTTGLFENCPALEAIYVPYGTGVELKEAWTNLGYPEYIFNKIVESDRVANMSDLKFDTLEVANHITSGDFTAMGDGSNYTTYKAGKLVYESTGLEAELYFPLVDDDGIIATQEWVNAQNFGGDIDTSNFATLDGNNIFTGETIFNNMVHYYNEATEATISTTWGDNGPETGLYLNSARGAGTYYGSEFSIPYYNSESGQFGDIIFKFPDDGDEGIIATREWVQENITVPEIDTSNLVTKDGNNIFTGTTYFQTETMGQDPATLTGIALADTYLYVCSGTQTYAYLEPNSLSIGDQSSDAYLCLYPDYIQKGNNNLYFPEQVQEVETIATREYVNAQLEAKVAELEAKIAALEALLPEIVRL